MENRRKWLRQVTAATTGAAALPASLSKADSNSAVIIDPAHLFEISPRLYMQVMEPLGATDSSVEAAWDYGADDW